jgi:hypothetical protein
MRWGFSFASVSTLFVLALFALPVKADVVYYACVNRSSGEIKLIELGETCHKHDYMIEWNSVGPQGPQGEPGETGPPGPEVEQQIGTKVAPGLFEVHSRVLWDVGWMEPAFGDGNAKFTYWEQPKPLVYGYGRTRFLRPLEGYGIPEVQEGATRKVRLYVHYGHQWDCGGTVTVGIGDVEFSLPDISGFYGDMAAGWSDFKEYAEYEHVGHAGIQVYMKDFVYEGGQCGPYPGTGPDRPKGVIYRVEAHFYDEFPE